MPTEVIIVGPNGISAQLTPNGEMVTAPLEYSEGVFKELNVVDTSFNFFTPTSGKRRVLTGILISTDRNVGVNGASIVVYEATASDIITVSNTILQLDMTKNQVLPMFGLRFITTEGRFINAKTDDDTVFITLTGYEVDSF